MKQNFTLKINLIGSIDCVSARKKENLSANIDSLIPCIKKVIFTFLFSGCLFLTNSFGQLAAWDFTGEASQLTSSAEVFNANLDGSNLMTRGPGAAPSTGGNSFRTTGFQNNGISTTNTDYFQITLSASPGNVMSLSTIDARFAGTADFAASPGVSNQFAYSLDGTNFTIIGSPQITIGTPVTLPQLNLTVIPSLQNVPATTTVTIRYYASGQTTTGGWGFFSSASGVYGLTIGGTTLPAGIVSQADGLWSNPTTWAGGIVPSPSDNVTINHVVSAGAIVRNAGTFTTVNNRLEVSGTFNNGGGSTLINGTFQLNAGGFASGSAFIYGSFGILNFNDAGNYGVDNNHVYWPSTNGPFNVNVLQNGMTLNSGANRSVAGTFSVANSGSFGVYFPSATLTINGTCRLDAGAIFRNTPTYGNSSTLVYNVSYGVSNEWTGNSTTAGVGVPQNVTIQNSAVVSMPNSNRGMAGNLNISSGGLTLNGTSGDLILGGNWTRSSTANFTPNNRAVFFNGTGTHTVTVSATGTETFNFLIVAGSGTLRQATGTSIVVNSNNGLGLSSSNGTSTIDLNGQVFTFSGGGNINLNAGARRITSTSGGRFIITNSLATLTNGGSVAFDANTTVELSNGMNFGGGSLGTINGTLQINAGGFVQTNSPTYGASSLLLYNTGNNFTTSGEWTGGGNTNPVVGVGVPGNVTFQNSGTNISLAADRGTPGNVTISAGARLTLNVGDLYLGGNLAQNGGATGLFNSGKAVQFVQSAAIQTISATTGPVFFDLLIINKPSGTVQLISTDVTINTNSGRVLQLLNAGTFDLNGRALNLNNNNGDIYVNGARFISSTVAGATINVAGAKVVSNNFGTGTLSLGSNITVILTNTIDFGMSSGVPITSLAGTLRIDLNGGVNINAPIYQSTSTLIYNTGLSFVNSAEWTGGGVNTVVSGYGVPGNVIIQNAGTNVSMAGNRGLQGNLEVRNGATLTLNGTLNNDLYTKGNLTFTGTGALNGNGRAIFFVNNSSIQTISSVAALTIPYVVFSPASGNTVVQLLSPLTISAPLTGNVISFNSGGDILDINGHSLTIGTTNIANTISGSGTIKGSTASELTVLGTGSIGTLNFTPSFQNLGTFTIQRENGIVAATLGTPLTINSSLALTNGLLALGNNDLTLSAAVASSGSDNAFVVTNGTGSLRKIWSGTGTFIYHVGEATGTTEYSPATLQFVGGVFGVNNYTGVRVVDNIHPNIPVTADNYITRYWAVSSSAIDGTTLDYNFTGTYLPADVMGSITDALSGRWDGTNWTDGAALAANTVSVTGLTTLPTTNDFTGAKITGKNHFFRSIITGNWNSKASWESSKDGSTNWVNATNYPGTAAGGVNIRNTHTISLTADEKARLLTIETGGTLTNTNIGGGYVLSIADDGTAANDFIINGTYELFGTGPAFATGATAIVNTNGLVRANGNLNAQSDVFARANNVSFQTSSVFEWNTTEAFAFSNVTYFPNATASTIPIFRLRQTPTNNIGSGQAAIINGVFQVNSNITLFGSSPKTFRNGITGSSILTQNNTSGNSFNITGPSATLGGASLRIVLNTQLNLTGTITVPVDSSVVISGANIDNNISGNVLRVNGTLDITDVSINNNLASVIINGIIRTRNTGGFTGSGAIPSGTVTLNNSTSTVEYYADANQIVTSRPDYFNVILSGSFTKTPTSGFDPDGTITISGTAIFDCTGYNMGDAGTSLTMTGGKLIVSTGGTQPAMGGLYNLTGGIIEFAGASATSIRTQTYQNIEVTGNNVGNSLGNISLRTNGNFIIRENGVFEINADAIVGLGTNERVTVDLGGTFRTGDPDGFSGATGTSVSTTIDNVTLNPLSNVVYSRSGNQTITNTHTYQNLELSGTGIKTPPLGATLTIQGNLIKSGTSTFNPNNGLVLLNGIGTQSFAGLPYSRLQLTNGSKTTAGSASIDSLLKIDASTTLNVGSGDSIVILSTAARTASVGVVEGSINYLGTGLTAGKFVVQRYLLNGRKWRLLSVPTNNPNQTVLNSWQENRVNNTGFGFNILDTRSNWSMLGYDGLGNNSSIKKYNPIADSWDAIDNTNLMPLQTEDAYIAFVAGDRSITFPGSGSTTLRTRGQLLTGSFVRNVPGGQFALIRNPYASRIDIRNFNFSGVGIDQSIYVWDPSLTSFYGLGAFNQLFKDGANYRNQFTSPIYGTFNSINNFIESGQAFLVRATGLQSITIEENDKVLGSVVSNFVPGDPQQLRLHLNVVPNGGSPILVDGVMTQFDTSYSKTVDYLDIKKINPFGESVSWDVEDSLLVIERRAPVTSIDTLHLKLGNLRMQSYQWEVIGENLDFPGREGFLIDRFLNRTSPINMTGATTIQFNVQSNPASYAEDRFYIVFRQQAAGPLPVTFTTVTATRNADKTIGVQWKVEQEINITKYEVERSSNGSLFTAIHSRTATMNNGGAATYNYADVSPFAIDNFYRIKATSIDGQVQYSEIVKVASIKAQPMITAFPNPVVDQRLQLQFQQQPIGRYQLQLSNGAGQVVWNKNIQLQQNTQNLSLSLPAKLATGRYQLLIVGADAVKTNLTLYVQ